MRTDPWPIVVLATLLLVVVAFTSVAAASRLAPGMATERSRVIGGHHLSMRMVSRPAPSQPTSQHPAPTQAEADAASRAVPPSTR